MYRDSEMKASKEIIWHFICTSCNLWWSVACQDDWEPRKLFCPHCGRLDDYTVKK